MSRPPPGHGATAGVKVTAVKTLYIGAGNRTAATPGGLGKLCIDDIRVTRP